MGLKPRVGIIGAGAGKLRSSPVKRVASAVGEGSMAIAFAGQYLKETESELAQ